MIPDDAAFDAQSVTLMGRVCDEAFHEVRELGFFATAAQSKEARRRMARRILGAVALGERDPERLKFLALGVVHG